MTLWIVETVISVCKQFQMEKLWESAETQAINYLICTRNTSSF